MKFIELITMSRPKLKEQRKSSPSAHPVKLFDVVAEQLVARLVEEGITKITIDKRLLAALTFSPYLGQHTIIFARLLEAGIEVTEI